MRFDVVTLFPELFTGPLGTGLVGKAFDEGLAEIGFVDPRTFTHDRHRSVDDAPYGGGAGMVMKPEPLVAAIEAAKARGGGEVLLMSPQGAPLTQPRLRRWARADHLVLVAGRYEGFDERIREVVDEEVSLGDYVLTGGEYAALVIVDGVVRLLPGTLGNQESHETDSFEHGLLEHPQYTRPARFRDAAVPAVLTSGDHARIAKWRREQSLLRTRARRPELLSQVGLGPEDRSVLWGAPAPRPRPALAVACPPSPEVCAELAALAAAYELERVALVPQDGDVEALRDALEAAPARRHPVPLPPPKRRRDTPTPLEVRPQAALEVVARWPHLEPDAREAWVAVGAHAAATTIPPAALQAARDDGRTWGLAVGADLVAPRGAPLEGLVGALPPIRAGAALGVALSPLQQAAVALDRVLGEG